MSADLVWQIIRNNHAFLKKQRGIRKTFSTEPNNLKNFNSPRLSGIANRTVLGVAAAADGKGVIFTTSHPVGSRRVKSGTIKTTLKKNSRRTFKTIRSSTKGKRNISKKLRSLAVRRASALLSSQRVKADKATDKKTEKSKKP